MGTITYNAAKSNIEYIFRATSGGTVFSSNLAASTAFDYFTDTAVANDAIYFGGVAHLPISDLYLTIGTAIAGVDVVLVWEYYAWPSGGRGWRAIHDLSDGTAGFTSLGERTVQFPIQACGYYTTINGVSTRQWVRCRIVSLSAITEGGANATTRAQRSDGKLNITNYTDASPCTWLEVYTWCTTNAPQIGAVRLADKSFKLSNCWINIVSRLRSTAEIVFLGNGNNQVQHSLAYLHSGTLVGTDQWSAASYYYFCSIGAIASSGANMKIYGGAIDYFYNNVDGVAVYGVSGAFSMARGEMIGVFCPFAASFSAANIDRCTVNGNIAISPVSVNFPTRLSIANSGSYIILLYGNGLTIRDLSFALPAAYIVNGYFNLFGCQLGNEVTFVNPSTFARQTSNIKVVGRALSTAVNLLKLFYFDDSAGTYTDYTAQSASATADDVPLSGDVGDCYYFLCPYISGTTHPALAVTMTPQANDYAYLWEYRRSGTWYPAFVLDSTENFTKVGQIILGTTISAVIDSHAINGTTGYWYRLRIVTKGSTNPSLGKVTTRAQNGVSDCKFNEKYSVALAITTESGVAIPGATVTLTDRLGTVTTLIADGDGLVSTDLLATMTTLDAYAPDADYNYTQTIYSPYTLAVSAPGYETYRAGIASLEKPIDQAIALKSAIDTMPIIGGGMALRADPTNSTADRDLLINL
jgi:hypothetical protein